MAEQFVIPFSLEEKMLDFGEIKKIKIIEVCARYGLRLRYRGEWANAQCPLPTHKQGDKARSFTVNLPQNYWRCFSESCNEKNSGRKGGDVINFVALMENCRERDAALKLAEWYGIAGSKKPPQAENKTAQHIAERSVPKGTKEAADRVVSPTPTKRSPDGTPSAIAVKGYMQEIDAWFDELFGLNAEVAREEYWQTARNGVKAKLIESWRNGKLQRAS